MTGVTWRGSEPSSVERLALREERDRVLVDSTVEVGGEGLVVDYPGLFARA